jgi:hypothetical protein
LQFTKRGIPDEPKKFNLMAAISSAIFNGLYDAIQFPVCFFVLYGSSTLLKRSIQATLINLAVFTSSFLAFQVIVKPISTLLPQIDYTVIYFGFWVYPTYTLAFLLNYKNFSEIARRSFEIFTATTKVKSNQVSILASDFVKLMYKSLFMFVHFLVCFVVSFIPTIGPILSILLLTFVGSFYSFEYHWIQKKWTFDQQLEYFETRWPYFFGFGLPLTLLCFLFPILVQLGIVVFLFPLVFLVN